MKKRQPELTEIQEAAQKYGFSLDTVSGFEAAEQKAYEAITEDTQEEKLSVNTERKITQKRWPDVDEINSAAKRLNLSITTPESFEAAEKEAFRFINLTEVNKPQSKKGNELAGQKLSFSTTGPSKTLWPAKGSTIQINIGGN